MTDSNLFQAEQVPVASSPLNVLGFDQPIRTDYALPEPTVTIDTPTYYLDEFGPGGEGAAPFALTLELI